jgi:hypothetical protein
MTADEKRLQQALQEIKEIADSVQPGDPREDLFYKFGKIIGTAKFHGEMVKIGSRR